MQRPKGVRNACHAGSATLLQQLIDGATGDTVPVATLLRQLKVIAARTGAEPLDEWVGHELDGYPDVDLVPGYRGPKDMVVLGDFTGFAGSEVRNLPIPPGTFPEDMRDPFRVSLTQPVAELAHLSNQESTLTMWPPEAVRLYNVGVQKGLIQPIVREDMVLIQATRPIAAAVFIRVLDAVRTRVLDLALQLEKDAPAVGQPDASAETTAQAVQVINNYFNGSATNVAIASTNVAQDFTVTVQLPAAGDEDGLLRYLGANGVAPEQLLALRQALADDRAETIGGQPPRQGSRVTAWLAAAKDAATNALGGTIAAAVMAYFGN